MNVRSRYNFDKDENSQDTGLWIASEKEEENLTKQEFAEEVDINTILRRFNVTGELPSGVRMPTYGDFTEVYDYHSAANAIAEANEAFEQMPADVRLRFNNDPAAFLAFCDKEENRDEAIRLGLVPPPTPSAPETPAPVPQPGTGPEITPTPTPGVS